MQSKQSLNKISNYSGLAVSLVVHGAAVYFLLSHNFDEIKIGEQKPIKIALNSFTPVPQVSAPQIAEQMLIPEPTPPAPPPPPEPPKPEPKKVEKPKREIKKVEPKKEKKIEPKPEPVIAQPVQPIVPPASINTNLPANNKSIAAAPVQNVTPELNLSNSQGDEDFTKVIIAVKRYKSYPNNARRMKHQGIVEVRFLLKQDGSIDELKVSKSSGFESLDNGALENIQRASSEFPKPKQDRYLRFPISYTLK